MSECNAKWPIVIWLLQLVLLAPVLVFLLANLYTQPTLGPIAIATILACGYVAFVLLFGFTRRGQRWIRAYRLQLAAFACSGLLTYLVCEVGLTGASLMGFRVPSLDEKASIWLFENSQNTIHFDPIRGFRLSTKPSRTTRITYGTIEYVSEIRGNNQGFPDRDDFSPQRSEDNSLRLAVFGDSFSAAAFLERNWPDYVEDQTRDSTRPLRLLNFSVSGGGVANWWSVLTRIVEAEGYELDGLVFAVYADNLRRRFCVAEHRGYDRHMFGRARTWNPQRFPHTDEEAKRCLKTLEGYIVSTDQFDAALAGEWAPANEHDTFSFVPHLARNLLFGFQKAWSEIPSSSYNDEAKQDDHEMLLEADRIALLEDVRRSLKDLKLPVMVVYVPRRFELLEHGDELEVPTEVRDFANLVDADLINGGDAFDGMTKSEIRSAWFPFDGHWAQGGSDRFGEFMVRQLQNWPAARAADPVD